jgi:hypothetical protein
MLSDKDLQLANAIGQICAASLFVVMMNSKNRGPNFSWSVVSDYAANAAAVKVSLTEAALTNQENMPLLQKAAEDAARDYIEEYLKVSDIENSSKLEEGYRIDSSPNWHTLHTPGRSYTVPRYGIDEKSLAKALRALADVVESG